MNYPVAVMQRVKELTAAGFNPSEVRRIMERETGHRVSRWTVRRWTNESIAEAKRADDRVRNNRRRAQARAGRLGTARHTVVFQEQRARSLLAAGLSNADAAAVMAFDYPQSGWSVRRVADINADGAAARPALPSGRRPLCQREALERAAELNQKGWNWTAIAHAMTEYHDQEARSGDSWRASVVYAGFSVQRRAMSPARQEHLGRLNALRVAA